MAIFVKFGDIEGEATLAGHTGYSIANHFRWGAAQRIAQQSDFQRTGRPKYEAAVITKRVDSTSTELIASFDQNVRMSITVKATNVADLTAGNVAYELVFKQASVVAFEYAFTDGNLVENISIDYSQYDLTYFDPVTGGGRSSYSGLLSER